MRSGALRFFVAIVGEHKDISGAAEDGEADERPRRREGVGHEAFSCAPQNLQKMAICLIFKAESSLERRTASLSSAGVSLQSERSSRNSAYRLEHSLDRS